MKDVQELAAARPKQLCLRTRGEDLLGCEHVRDGIDASIGDPPGKNRDDCRRCEIERIGDGAHLIKREDRGHVEDHAFGRQRPDELACRLSLGVGDRNFHVHVRSPRHDCPRLFGHTREVVGKDLE